MRCNFKFSEYIGYYKSINTGTDGSDCQPVRKIGTKKRKRSSNLGFTLHLDDVMLTRPAQ